MLLLFLNSLVSLSYAGMVTSEGGRYCSDDSLTMNWFDAEIYCNDNFGGFASYHSEEEWQELRALSLTIGSGFNWNGAYEVAESFEIVFSDGSPYDYAVATENDAVSDAEYGLCSSRDALYLGINPYYTTGFMCNCGSVGSEDELCPSGCSTVSFDGCNRCRCRKDGNAICQDKGCSPTMERYCMFTEVVHQACPEDCARYDLGGRQCLCKQMKGYMVCEPESALSPDLKPGCTQTIEEFEAEFDVNSSINWLSFASEHWILSSLAVLALITSILVFVYRARICANKGEYQSLLS